MEFDIIGQGDPFLLVKLQKNEKIYCESNAMVTMDGTLELKSKMQGGLLSALARKMANGESFFNQYIEATSGYGETLLSPTLPGDIEILDVGKIQYMLNDGSFLAASSNVELTVKTQKIGQALFGGTGGFFITKTSGEGKLAISGLGTVFAMDVTSNNPVMVDNYHVVAWDSELDYELSLSTQKSAGLLGNIVNSVTSGEGIITKFKGNGKVYVCSRNRGAFLQWVSSSIPRR